MDSTTSIAAKLAGTIGFLESVLEGLLERADIVVTQQIVDTLKQSQEMYDHAMDDDIHLNEFLDLYRPGED